MSTAEPFDLVVVGGGPGGYVAALRAAQLNMRVALVEREHLGGVCLNWGCIPTKVLLHAADNIRRIRCASDLGIEVDGLRFDLGRMIARSRAVAGQLNGAVKQLLRKAGVAVLEGTARLVADGTLEVVRADGTTTLMGNHVILATGARPRGLQQLPFDGERVWSYRDALQPITVPASLLVVGAGAIGMEFASFYATLGTHVTILESQPQVLPEADQDVSRFVLDAFQREGITVRTGVTLLAGEAHSDGVVARIETAAGPESVSASHALVAIGLAGNVEGIGLEHTAVRLRGNEIEADAFGATGDPRIFAIGDVTGAPMLAHRASHQAVACVERIAGLRSGAAPNESAMPACTYCHPQTASFGLTEQQAARAGRAVKVGRFPLQGNGKAISIGEPSGFVKTLFDASTGGLLGAHIVGPDATELIHGFALAATLESTEEELIETVFPHPTLSEAMHESVLAAFGRALHI